MGETVQTAAIADGAVTTAKLAALAVTTAKLGADAVTEPKIKDGEIVNADVAAAAAIALSKLALDLTTHASRHENGGVDEIDATGLTGAGTKVIVGSGGSVVISGGTSQIKGYIAFYRLNGDGDYISFFFKVPHDFTSLVSAVVVVNCDVAGTGIDVDIASAYGKEGEDADAATESDTTTTYNFAADEYATIDISGILSGIEAGDIVGVQIKLRETYNLDVIRYQNPFIRYA